MVMILLGADAKAQHHYIQEGRLWQLHTTRAVIVAGAELQLVHAAAIVITLQQRRVATTVAVGQGGGNPFQLRAFDAVQFNLDRAAGAAVRGVQYVCGQASHGVFAPPVDSKKSDPHFFGAAKKSAMAD